MRLEQALSDEAASTSVKLSVPAVLALQAKLWLAIGTSRLLLELQILKYLCLMNDGNRFLSFFCPRKRVKRVTDCQIYRVGEDVRRWPQGVQSYLKLILFRPGCLFVLCLVLVTVTSSNELLFGVTTSFRNCCLKAVASFRKGEPKLFKFIICNPC